MLEFEPDLPQLPSFTPLIWSKYGPAWFDLWTKHVAPTPGSAVEWALTREFCRRLREGKDEFALDTFLFGKDYIYCKDHYDDVELKVGRQLLDAFCTPDGANKLRHMCRTTSAMASLSFTGFAVIAFHQLYNTSAAFRARPKAKTLRQRMNKLRHRFKGGRECSDRNWRDVLKTLGSLFNSMESKPAAPADAPAPRFRYLVVAEASELPTKGQPDDVCIAEDTREAYMWSPASTSWLNFGSFPLRVS